MNTRILHGFEMCIIFLQLILSFIIIHVGMVLGQESVQYKKIDTKVFRREAINKWTEVLGSIDSYTCKHYVVSYNQHDDKIAESETFYAVLFPASLRESIVHNDDTVVVSSNNSEYSFELKKSKNENWNISYVEKIGKRIKNKDICFTRPYRDFEIRRKNGLYRISTISGASVQIYPELSLPFLFTDSDFKISNVVEYNNENDSSYIRFDFTYPMGKEENKLDIKSGSIELDKSTYFLRRIEYVEDGDPGDTRDFVITFEYDKKRNNTLPFLSKRTMVAYYKGEVNWKVDETYEYSPDENLTEDRFKLSYYGFNEPIFEEDSNLDSRWYFLGAGIAFILLATVIGRSRKRRRESSTDSSGSVVAG